jgi:hypothetical protein
VSLLEIEADDSPADPDVANGDDVVEILAPAAMLRVPTTADSIPPIGNESEIVLIPTDRLRPATDGESAKHDTAVADLHELESVDRSPSTPMEVPPQSTTRQTTPQQAVPSLPDRPVAIEDKPADNEFDALDRPIQRVRADAQTLPGELPPNHSAAKMTEFPPIRHSMGISRSWYGSAFGWAPTALKHQPVYLEDLNAERYGYNCGVVQGLASSALFFGTIPTLPYRTVVHPPWDEQYTLGLDRPGNCVPLRWHRLPWHTGAAIVQAGAIAGVIFLVP